MLRNLSDLSGQAVLITGATSGTGRACAVVFAHAGAMIAIADLNADLGGQTVAEIEALETQAIFLKTDVSRSADVQAMVAGAVAHFGRLDVAINNAGISPKSLPIDDIDEASWDRIIAIDLTGAMLCMKYELRQMIAAGRGGAIINTASIAGMCRKRTAGRMSPQRPA